MTPGPHIISSSAKAIDRLRLKPPKSASGFVDGACLDWIAHDRDLDRQALHGLILAALLGAVAAAGDAGR